MRLSQSLENVVVEPGSIKRSITLGVRLHSLKGEQSQVINVTVRIDSTVQQVMQYIAQISQCPPTFLNLFHA